MDPLNPNPAMPTDDPFLPGMEPAAVAASSIRRDQPDPAIARAALVRRWEKRVKSASAFWDDKAFKQMRSDMAFAAGKQWQQDVRAQDVFMDPAQERYVANITLRHVQSRTASIYGKNPTFTARRKARLTSTVWDGTQRSLQEAQLMMQAAAAGVAPVNNMAAMIVADAEQAQQQSQLQARIAKTLELLFEHELDEQPLNFKVQMKTTVRRALTTGVGYVKLGFQRVMQPRPEVETKINDYSQKLAELERLSADLQDGEVDQQSAEADTLRTLLNELAQEQDIVVREGLALSYPNSWAIIPDMACQQLRGFVGAGWVAEEFFLSADEIKRTYKVDVGGAATGTADSDLPSGTRYHRTASGNFAARADEDPEDAFFRVWEIYSRTDGLVFVVCEGYTDFLVEPGAPDVFLERFYPWFPFVVNECYDDCNIFPPSDVFLMRNPQMELNRARQGLRDHRRAAMPKYYARKGVLSEDDKEKFAEPSPHELIELDGLAPQEKVQDVIQAFAGAGVDPNLYEPAPAYEDYLRVLGQQEANLGGTSGATATEASIAEGSRVSGVSAVVDDLDEFLTEIARASGQVLLLESSPERVKEVIGPGAIWPDLTRSEVAKEIYLDVQAGSTGRPNKAQEVQTAQQVYPLLMQLPNIDPEFLARDLLRRMDDNLDLTDAFQHGMPSMQMLNGMTPGAPGEASPEASAEGNAPEQQGPAGAQNAPDTAPPQVNAAPRPGRPPLVPMPANPGGV